MKDFYFGCYISIRYLCKMYIQFFASEKLKFISLFALCAVYKFIGLSRYKYIAQTESNRINF